MQGDKLIFVEKFIKQVEAKVNIDQIVGKLKNVYAVEGYKLEELTGEKFLQCFKSIQQKFYRKLHFNFDNIWLENQLRLFIWSLVCYSDLNSISIHQFNSRDWTFFSQLFTHKSEKLFEYQSRALLKDFEKGKIWSQEEQTILLDILEKHEKRIKWNQISKQFYFQSNRVFFRSAKQCREHWNNHLDPKKIKGRWTLEECLTMFKFVRENGRKWAKLVKLMGEVRNQHSLKNKFNSLMKKQKNISQTSSDFLALNIIINKIQYSIDRHENKKKQIFEQQFEEFFKKEENFHTSLKTSTYTQKFRMKLQHFKVGSFSPSASNCTITSLSSQKQENKQEYSKNREKDEEIYEQEPQLLFDNNNFKLQQLYDQISPFQYLSEENDRKFFLS